MGTHEVRKKFSRYLPLLFLAVHVIPSISLAATHFVRAGATGNSIGSDWTNAFTQLPAALVRGDTYYIADGNYSSYTFNDGPSGTTVITIKKATIADHGTETGWLNSYGDGQAVFTVSGGADILTFTTSFWVFDGQARTTPKSGHGFKVDQQTSDIGMHILGDAGNITIRYTEVQGTGLDSPENDRNIRAVLGNNDVITLSFIYIHDSGNTPLQTGNGVTNLILEHSVIARNSSSPTAHAEAIADQGSQNVIIRYNVFEDIEGTGQIIVLGRGGGPQTASDWEIYGNVFMYHAGNPFNREGNGNGAIACINNEVCTNWKVYNNTFINMKFGLSSRISFSQSTGTNREIKNNVWFDCDNASHNGTYTADSNYYMLTDHDGAETNVQETPTTDPFVNFDGEDFHLTRATDAGVSLGAPYNTDLDGLTRGADGTWDRGAFEFVSNIARPEPPLNLRAIVR